MIEAVTPHLLELGLKVLIITNDIVTTEDAKHVRKMLKGVLCEDRIIGVETGACPHTAVREDPSMNLAAVEEIGTRTAPASRSRIFWSSTRPTWPPTCMPVWR